MENLKQSILGLGSVYRTQKYAEGRVIRETQ